MEMALLDLFAQDKNCNVETLLGLDGCDRRGRYTAVLGDDETWKFTFLAENDRIVDNNKFQQFFGHMFANQNRLVRFDCGHAIQFEKPRELADEIFRLITRVSEKI